MNIRMDQMVSVVLTECSAKLLNENEEFVKRLFPGYEKKTYGAGDKYTCKLWEIMTVFGGEQAGWKIRKMFDGDMMTTG